MATRHGTLILAFALTVAPPPALGAAPVDVYGDPLPAGALARMGSLRLRFPHDCSLALSCPLAFSPDGKVLAAGFRFSKDFSIRLWDPATGKELRRLRSPDGKDLRIAFSADGKRLAGMGDRTVQFWDPATGKPVGPVIRDALRFDCFALSPDGKVVATGYYNFDKVKPGPICLWDAATGRPLRRPAGPTLSVYRLAFSADGKRLLSACYDSGTGEGREILLWDTSTWKVLRRLAIKEETLALSPDGRTVAVKTADRIRLWDLGPESPRVRKDIKHHSDHRDSDDCLFSPDGRLLAIGGGQQPLRLWEVATGKELRRLSGPRSQGILPAAFTPDGKFLATFAGGGEVRVWDMTTGREVSRVGGHREQVWCLAFAPDGKTVLSGSADRTVRIWDARTGKELRRFEGHRIAVTALALSPGGRTVATGDAEGTVLLWDATTNREVRRLRLSGGRVESLVFAPDGRSLIGTTSEGDVRVWDAATGKLLRQFRVRRQQFSESALSPDGAVLAYTGWTPRPDRRTGVIQFRGLVPGLAPPAIRGAEHYESLAFTPDGKFLAAKAGHHGGQQRKAEWNVRVWETTSGKEVLAFRLDDLGAVAFSPDGRTLFVGGGRWRESAWGCRAWDLPTGKPLGDFAGNLGPVEALAVSRDSARVATGGFDGTILVWDATRLLRPAVAVPEQLAGAWTDLAGADAARAYRAIWGLTSHPRRAVAFVRRHLRPVPRPDPKRLHRLTAALDSDSFAEREKAAAELEGLGELAEGALRAALADPPSLEARRRAERVLARLTPPSGERLRALRAVVVLERIGTPEARKVLEELAGGAPEARLTREARAALKRLAGKP